MIKRARRLLDRFAIRLMRSNEYESERLRAFFKKRYNVEIGMYSYGCFNPFRIPPGTKIGRYCSFANTARIFDANHPMASLSTHPFFYHPGFGVVDRLQVVNTDTVVEDDVWFGHNALVMHSVTHIGRGAIVGAGSIVTKNVPRYAVVAGNPARLIRYRFDDETIARIEASRWWELDKDKVRALVRTNPEFAFSPAAVKALAA